MRFIAIWYNLKCFLGIHKGEVVSGEQDPFQGLPGHMATEFCGWCDKHRRYLGYNGVVKFVLPWVKWPMKKDEH